MKLFLALVLMLSYSNNLIIQKELLEGKWSLCRVIDEGMVTQYNVCHQMELAKNGKGKIIIPSKEEISFMYALSSDSNNNILSFFETDQSYFGEKEYYYKVFMVDSLKILELSSKDGQTKYPFFYMDKLSTPY